MTTSLVETSPALTASESPKSTNRLQIVDVLRGFALFGILFINVLTFRGPGHTWTGLDNIVDTWVVILGQGKFVTSFSILFGLSLALQFERVGDKPYLRSYVRRIAALLMFGVLHFVLLWEGDILMQYVIPGIVLLFFVRRKPRTIALSAAAFYLLAMAFFSLILIVSASQRANQPPSSEPPLIPLAAYTHSTYSELVSDRWQALPNFLAEHLISSVFLLYTFLTGLYVAKRGILHHPKQHIVLIKRTFRWGLPVGLVMNVVSILGLPYRNALALPLQLIWFFCSITGLIVLALGYLSGMILLWLNGGARIRQILTPLAAVGRMSLSNYILQTIILTTLFYGYGLGWYDQFTPIQGIIIPIGIYTINLIFSNLWMARFRYGPLEWIWRCITNWKIQPIAKKDYAASTT